MDRVLHFDAFFLELVGQFADAVLRLRDGHAVAGHDDYLARVREHRRDVVDRRFAHDAACRGACRPTRRGRFHRPECTEEHVGHGSIHRFAHHERQERSRGAHERTGDDQDVVAERETRQGRGETGKGVKQRDDHRHVGAADRQDEQHAEHRGRYERREKGRQRRDVECHEDEPGDRDEREQAVDHLLARIHDRAPGHHLLQFQVGNDRTGETDRPDDRRQDARNAGVYRNERRGWIVREKFRGRHHRRRSAARAVEDRDHLRHRGHFHGARRIDADRGSRAKSDQRDPPSGGPIEL